MKLESLQRNVTNLAEIDNAVFIANLEDHLWFREARSAFLSSVVNARTGDNLKLAVSLFAATALQQLARIDDPAFVADLDHRLWFRQARTQLLDDLANARLGDDIETAVFAFASRLCHYLNIAA